MMSEETGENMSPEQDDASPTKKLPTHAVLHFSLNWCMDGLAVQYFDSLAEALDYARSFDITEWHKKDSLIITEIKATAKAGTDGRFQVEHLPAFPAPMKADSAEQRRPASGGSWLQQSSGANLLPQRYSIALGPSADGG